MSSKKKKKSQNRLIDDHSPFQSELFFAAIRDLIVLDVSL